MTAAPGLDVFDGKVVKAPFVWTGDKKRWKAWALKMRGFIGGVSPKLLKMMRIVEKHPGPIGSHDGWEEEQILLDHKLYSILGIVW